MDKRSKIIVGAIALAVVAASGVVLWLSRPNGDGNGIALTSPSPAVPNGVIDGLGSDLGNIPGFPPSLEDGLDENGIGQQPGTPPAPSTAPVNMTAETGPAEVAVATIALMTTLGMGGLVCLTRRYA